MQDLEQAIRRHLDAFLAGETSLDDFTDWMVGAAWNVESVGNAEARELAHAIEFSLIEASSGLLSINDFHSRLHGLSRKVHHVVSRP